MANATAKIEKVEVVTMVEKKTGVVLELTNEEAMALLMLVGKCTGADYTTAREFSSNIYFALRDAGYNLPSDYKEAFVNCCVEWSPKSRELVTV